MKVARVKAQDYLEDISESDQPGTAAVINSTRFQLDPMFEITHDGPDVKFDSEHMSYQIKTVPAPNEDLAETFAEYADWACQLNFLLHGQSLFPNPRMAVNQTLREKKLLPIQVELQILQNPKVHLQAEHTIQWNLSVQDRERIHDWQTMLESGKLEFLSFQNYQMKQLERQ